MRQNVSNLSVAQRRGVLFSMCLALILVVASVSSLNLALQSIAVDLHPSANSLTWIVDAYTVTLAALVLPFGAIGDRFGRRNVLLAGMALFGLAAAVAAGSHSVAVLIGARALMGAGAAMIMPGTLSTITAVFPEEERGKAVGVWSGFASAGAVIGMLVSGGLLEAFSWKANFVGTALLSVVAFVVAWRLSPNTADEHRVPLDVVGTLFSALGIGGLVFGIIEGADKGYSGVLSIAGFTAAIVGLVGFIAWELRREHPLLDVRLFRNRAFSTGTAGITIQFLAAFGFFFVGLQFLLVVLGYSPLHAALGLMPIAVVIMPMSAITPKLVDRFGTKAMMTVGLIFLGAGFVLLAQLTADSGYWAFLAGVMPFGIGIALSSTPATTAIVGSLPRSKQGVASAVNDTTREVGSALGIALLGSAFNSAYSGHITDRLAGVQGLPAGAVHGVQESPGVGMEVAHQVGGAGGAQLSGLVKDSFAAGLSHALWVGVIVVAVGLAFVLARAPRRVEPAVEVEPAEVWEAELAAV
jgi:EmrB/QacA subfamily drug resistance transporter